MQRRRSDNEPVPATMHPLASGMLFGPPHSMTPYPIRREPGSSPRMRTFVSRTSCTGTGTTACALAVAAAVPAACAAGSNARQDLVRYLGIRVDVLHVVQVIECIEKLHHRFCGLPLQAHACGRAL